MTEPLIEHKHRRNTTISLLEAKLHRGELAARQMLQALEQAMIRCGYTRDGIYNSRQSGWAGASQRGTVLLWEGGKIQLGRGLAKGAGGKVQRPFKANAPVGVSGMKARDLICVASNLAPFLDALENNMRHQADALAKAVETIQSMLERVEADPRPSDEPAQMSVDPDVEAPA